MNKLYDRIIWYNNTTPALNQSNLNDMSKAIDDIDDRVIAMYGEVTEIVADVNLAAQAAQQAAEDAQGYAQAAQEAAESAQGAEDYAERAERAEAAADEAEALTQATVFTVNFTTGNLMYTNEDIFDFAINTSNGNLEWEVE